MRRGLLMAIGAVLLAPAPGWAHVVYGSPTLWQLVRDADVVVQGRIEEPDRLLVLESPPLRRRLVTVEALAILKGDVGLGSIAFAPHGHGVAEYARGEEAVLFLRRIERVRELAVTPLARTVRWVSLQESTDKLSVTAGNDDPFVAAVRAYAAVERLPDDERGEALRRVTFRLIASPEPRLSAWAVRDLAMAADRPLVDAIELAVLEPLLVDRRVAIGTRIALLAELERRHVVVAPERWAGLVRDSTGAERLAVVRAAAAHPSPAVTAALLAVLAGGTADAAAAAAVSLGTPGNDAAVAALQSALAANDGRLRMAAIRGLGRIDTPPARDALAMVAAFHPDPPTRRRAKAEVAVLAGRHRVAEDVRSVPQ